MVSNNQRKQILKLKQKKYRQNLGLFVAEGLKLVNELLSSGWSYKYLFTLNDHFHPKSKLIDLSSMKQITHFKNPSPILGVFEIPKLKPIIQTQISIAVDGINDPGNLGTIIRLCDWFGINDLVCSYHTVDNFNSKVLQASMGSVVVNL